MKTTTKKTTAPAADTSSLPPVELIDPISIDPDGDIDAEIDSVTRCGVYNLTKDLQNAIAYKIPRYTEAALRALNACETPEQKRCITIFYGELLRGLFAAMQKQAASQFENHVIGFAPFSECSEWLNVIV